MTPDPAKPQLVRALGRWTMVALVLNGILGGGIFALPSDVARLLGPAAIAGYLLAAVAMAALVAVFAELSSQFREAGGPYLYARTVLGRFAGVQTGWFLWLMRLTAAASVANVFVTYLGQFWPGASEPAARAAILTAMFGGLAAVNYCGVAAGARLSNVVTIAKVATLGVFIVLGLVLVQGDATAPAVAPAPASLENWLEAFVVLVFAYGGFEASLIPAGETKNPRRDMPFALLGGLAVVTVGYVSIHYVTMTALPDLASSKRPLADAARAFAGPAGAALIAIGAMLSTFGWLAAQLLSAPRLTYALAERGDFPPLFARVHPRFRTPHVSIVIWAVIALALAIYGNFLWNAVLSVAARLVTYGFSCAALLRLRRTAPAADAWRAPGGKVLAGFGLVFSALLISRLAGGHAVIVAVVAALASANWFAVRGRAGG
jgi:APA family basic amino acid/polyamine antiporter